MKNLLLIALVIFSSQTISAQEWGSMNKNELTVKEIAPIWPGCESGTANERDNCFNTKLSAHVAKNFKYPAEAYKKNEQGKVIVEFIINEKGLVEVQKVSGGSKALQEEAKRNIMAIPKMSKPGMLAGKPSSVSYTVPFNFKTGK